MNEGSKICRILIVSDFVVEHFWKKEIERAFKSEFFNVELNFIMEESRIFNLELEKDVYDIVVVWFRLPEISGYTDYSLGVEEGVHENNMAILKKIKKQFSAFFLLISFDSYEENLSILEGCICTKNNIRKNLSYKVQQCSNENIVVLDLDMIIARIGFKSAYSMKDKYRWKCPYRQPVFQELAMELLKQYKITRNISPKCIVLDCDNVLWGGILAEDGSEGIQLSNIGKGSAYKDFQRVLLALYNRGLLLALASKNTKEDVEYVFEKHSEMILKKNNIVCMEVNWESKVNSLIRLANYLNISMDSFVFIDDSINEVQLINEMLPDVKTILFDSDTIFDNMREIFNVSCRFQGDTVEMRNDTYRANVTRARLKLEFEEHEEYLKALKTEIILRKAEDVDYNRISELSLRTNKCTIGKRYTLEELKRVAHQKEYTLYSVEMRDRYSDFGTVAAIGVVRGNKNAKLDLFCVSCRALGRMVENILFGFISKKFNCLEIEMYSTKKNIAFLEQLIQWKKEMSNESDNSYGINLKEL